MTILLFSIKTLMQIFIAPDTFKLISFGWWTSLILLSVGTSIGVTYGARRFQLKISDTNDIGKTKDWILENLLKNGLIIRENNDSGTTLESIKSFNRLFNNWFGTESVHIRHVENKIIVEGPFRHVDQIDSKLRFGKYLN